MNKTCVLRRCAKARSLIVVTNARENSCAESGVKRLRTKEGPGRGGI